MFLCSGDPDICFLQAANRTLSKVCLFKSLTERNLLLFLAKFASIMTLYGQAIEDLRIERDRRSRLEEALRSARVCVRCGHPRVFVSGDCWHWNFRLTNPLLCATVYVVKKNWLLLQQKQTICFIWLIGSLRNVLGANVIVSYEARYCDSFLYWSSTPNRHRGGEWNKLLQLCQFIGTWTWSFLGPFSKDLHGQSFDINIQESNLGLNSTSMRKTVLKSVFLSMRISFLQFPPLCRVGVTGLKRSLTLTNEAFFITPVARRVAR